MKEEKKLDKKHKAFRAIFWLIFAIHWTFAIAHIIYSIRTAEPEETEALITSPEIILFGAVFGGAILIMIVVAIFLKIHPIEKEGVNLNQGRIWNALSCVLMAVILIPIICYFMLGDNIKKLMVVNETASGTIAKEYVSGGHGPDDVYKVSWTDSKGNEHYDTIWDYSELMYKAGDGNTIQILYQNSNPAVWMSSYTRTHTLLKLAQIVLFGLVFIGIAAFTLKDAVNPDIGPSKLKDMRK